MSEGRKREFAAFGVPLDERKDRYEDSIELVRALWSGETVHHEGRHFRVDGERGEALAGPVRVGLDVFVCDVDDWVSVEAIE